MADSEKEPPIDGYGFQAEVINIFWDLNSWRGSNGFGPNQISLDLVEAWEKRFYPIPLIMLTIVKDVDILYLNKFHEIHSPNT